jgi:hypothetical protein
MSVGSLFDHGGDQDEIFDPLQFSAGTPTPYRHALIAACL